MSGSDNIKIFDPTKNLRSMQNFCTLLLLYSAVLLSVMYLSITSLVFLVGGLRELRALVQITPLISQVNVMSDIVVQYWAWWWRNKGLLGVTGANFFTIKLLSTVALPALGLTAIVVKFWYNIIYWRPFKKPPGIYGDAHWATQAEIRKAGLRSKKGMLMGQDSKGYLVTDGYQHALLFAPTGSGKGVGFIIPNLLYWTESVVCHDLKGENYQLTSGWRNRSLKQKTFVWEPANPDGISHCYNPLDWVSDKPGQMVDDVQKFSNLILQKKEFWENEARTLLVGVILYLVADRTKVKSFGEVVRCLRSDDFAYSMAVVLDTMGDKIHPVAYMNLAAFLQKADKERSGVVSTLNSGLELWANPIIDKTTSCSDFNVQLFKKEKTTVYVVMTPDNIQRLKSLMSMFYQQATDFLSKKMPGKDEPYGVLFIMDEFPTVGKLEQFLAGIAFFRGYHVRLFLVIQDTQQLKGTYEDAGMNSFLSNATYRITFAANNVETARLISELIGNQTVESSSYSKPRFFDLNPGSRSMNSSAAQRALLLPQEVISLPKDDQIILVEASAPIRTRKIKYYQDKMFTSRLWKQTEVPRQEIVVHKRSAPPANPQEQPQEQQYLPPTDAAADQAAAG